MPLKAALNLLVQTALYDFVLTERGEGRGYSTRLIVNAKKSFAQIKYHRMTQMATIDLGS
jgi:hypothetical protein